MIMAKKRQPTYGELAKHIEKMKADMEKEKARMAEVMASAFMTDTTARKLGDCTDADLKRIMSMLADHVDECLDKLKAEKQDKAAARAAAPQAQPATTEQFGTV